MSGSTQAVVTFYIAMSIVLMFVMFFNNLELHQQLSSVYEKALNWEQCVK